MRPLRAILAVFTILLLFTGCGEGDGGAGSADVPGVTDSTITVGSWAPLTGPAALWGAVGRGIGAYFDYVNDQGGVHGREIRYILKDDGYQPARTVQAVREMIDRENVFAFGGGVGTATGLAVMDEIVAQGIPWVSPSTGSTGWAYPGNRYVFSTFTPYFDEAAALVDYAVDSLGLTKLGILYLNDDYGESGHIGLRRRLAEHGLEVTEAVSHELMDTDLTSQVLRLQEAGAEAVLLYTTPKGAATAVGTAAKLDYRPRWLATSALADASLMYDITQGLWEGTIFIAPILDVNAEDPRMVQAREIRDQYAPEERNGVFLYAGMYFAEPFVEALRRAGPDLTREGFIEALESLDGFQGIGPPITFGPGRRQGTRAVTLARNTGPATNEPLTDWIYPDIDIDAAIAELEGQE